MAYGVDSFGKPVGYDQQASGTTGKQSATTQQCPQGQKFNSLSGQCEPVATPITQPKSNMTVAAPQGQPTQHTFSNAPKPVLYGGSAQGQPSGVGQPNPMMSYLGGGMQTVAEPPAVRRPEPTTYPAPNSNPPQSPLDKVYREMLGRAPDPTGAATFAGMSEDEIRRHVMQSDEYRARTGGGQPGGAGGNFQNDLNQFNQWTNGKPPTPQTLIENEQALAAMGWKVLRNAAGVAGKIQHMASGQVVDVIEAAGAGGKAWQNLYGEGGGGQDAFGGRREPSRPAPDPYVYEPYEGSAPPDYNPYDYAPHNPYEAPGYRDAQDEIIRRILESGGSMNPTVVAQIKEGQKDTVLDMQSQLTQQLTQDAARRGVAGGGSFQGTLRDVGLAGIGDISRSYRDTDINAVKTNRQDELDAIDAANGTDRLRFDEYLGEEGLKFDRERAQAGEGQFAHDAATKKSGEEFNRYLATQGLKLSAKEQEYLNWLREEGLLQDYARMLQGGSEFDRTLQLAIARFLAGD